MVVLYEHPLSPYAQKCKIAMREKKLDFQALTPPLLGSGQVVEEFLAVNPRGEVPALVDGEVAVFDSTIILEYLEDRWPAPALLPQTPYQRARARMIEDVCDTHYDAVNWSVLEVTAFRRAEGMLADELLGQAARQTAGLNAWLERQLGESEWFCESTFGWADLAAAPYVNTAAAFGNGPVAGSNLAAWLARVGARPSVAQTAAEAMAAFADFDDVASLLAPDLFTREYRDHRLEWMMRSGGAEVVVEGLAKGTIRFSREFS